MEQSQHVVCPECDAINRIPQDKAAQDAKCGKCSSHIFSAKVLELNNVRFPRHVQKNDIPIVVDFWAPWCGPCKAMAPVFSAAATVLEPRCRLIKINTETEQNLAQQYAIRSIPTLIIFKAAREVARVAGALDSKNLLAWVEQNL